MIARGHDDLRTRCSSMFVALPDMRVEAVARTDVGPFVVQEKCVAGRPLASERHFAVDRIADDAIVRERLLR